MVPLMEQGFVYPIGSTRVSTVDLWIPLVPNTRETIRTSGRGYSMRVIGRLKSDVTIPQASVQMTQIRDGLAVEHPRWFVDRGVMVRPLKQAVVSAEVRSWMMMLLGAVAVVFLAACANVANLLLARASGRSREIGVRAAMGATRGQLVRGLIVESVVLSMAGTACGLLVAYWGVDILRATLPAALPRVWTIAVDLRVVGVASLVALSTGVLCGLLPALQMSRADVSATLQSSSRSSTAAASSLRARAVFLVVEVALAAVLLVGAGLFMSSFFRLVNTDLWQVMPGGVTPEPATFDQMYAGLIAARKLNMILLAIFGSLALLIAAIGIYGVIAYLVEQRTKEIGVRMALGAVPSRILSMILSRAAMAISAGLAIGFLGAAWLERLMLAFVYRGIPQDPTVYGGAAVLLLALGLLAAYLPARRAAKVDPLVALRGE